MRARVGALRIRVGAVLLVTASVLSLGASAAATPTETSTSGPDSATSEPAPDPTSDPSSDPSSDPATDTNGDPTTSTTVDPFGLPAEVDSLLPGSRPGSTVQTRTPPPPPTTTTTTTTTLPPPPPTIPEWVLPNDSGTGRRAVYSKSRQRVWAVDSNGTVLKTHRVSGKLKWCDPRVGTYSVFSRSRYTNSIQNPAIKWGYMIRFTTGCEGGNIGFHEIPKKYGVPVQSIWQLGQPLSAGCVRQATSDAQWMWNWAWVGTKVVVLP